jgi:acid stress-induced BolA-like protein IbaG/YrbA
MATEPLQRLLQDAFPDATEQHRLVNDALAAPLRDGTIHELRIKTKGSE